MAKEANSGLPTTFLRVNSDGFFYEKAKEPTEGFEEVTLKNGDKTYHKKYVSTDDGYLSYIGIKEVTFAGSKTPIKFLELSINSGESSDRLTFNLFKQNGNLDDYVKSIALALPNLDFSEKISLAASRKKGDDGYINRTIYINMTDKERGQDLVMSPHRYGEEGDIPGMEKKVNVDGTIKYDFTAQDTFIFNILKEQIERFKEFKGVNSTPKAEANQEAAPTANVATTTAPQGDGYEPITNSDDEDPDDLPF